MHQFDYSIPVLLYTCNYSIAVLSRIAVLKSILHQYNLSDFRTNEHAVQLAEKLRNFLKQKRFWKQAVQLTVGGTIFTNSVFSDVIKNLVNLFSCYLLQNYLLHIHFNCTFLPSYHHNVNRLRSHNLETLEEKAAGRENSP